MYLYYRDEAIINTLERCFPKRKQLVISLYKKVSMKRHFILSNMCYRFQTKQKYASVTLKEINQRKSCADEN